MLAASDVLNLERQGVEENLSSFLEVTYLLPVALAKHLLYASTRGRGHAASLQTGGCMSSIRAALLSAALATVLWSTSVVAANQVNLPLELLTDGSYAQPFIATVSLALAAADLANASEIYFVCRRCVRYAVPEFRSVKAPVAAHTASVRFVGGAASATQVAIPWLDVTNQNITLPIEEQISGGVDGGFYAIHATVPLTDAMRKLLVSILGLNASQFRSNGTDGASNGFFTETS